MKTRGWFVLASILILCLLTPLKAGRTVGAAEEKWVAVYDGPANGYDYASDWAADITVDAKGYIYVTGVSAYPYGEFDWTAYTATTIKYDSNGRRLWAATYKGGGDSEPADIAVDTAGNVYITGYQSGKVAGVENSDILTIKYDAKGQQVWARKYNGPYKDKPRDSWDYGEAIAVDAARNVYVAGTSTDQQGYTDYVTIKYDRNGRCLWTKRFIGDISGGQHAESIARDIAVDAAGNVYVTGESARSDGPFVYATVKYSADGDELWVHRYKARDGLSSYAMAIALDSAGNAYVYGDAEVSYWKGALGTVKINPAGEQLWAGLFVGGGSTYFYYDSAKSCLAVDGAGNVVITGSVARTDNNTRDYVTVKYDGTGRRLWARRYNGPTDSTDYPAGLALDGEGNVYVTGRSDTAESSNPDSFCEYATVKYGADGKLGWVKTYRGQGKPGIAWAAGIAVDRTGGVFVTGNSLHPKSFDDYDITTIKY